MKKKYFWLLFASLPAVLPAQSPEDGLILHLSADKPGIDLSPNGTQPNLKDIVLTAGIPGVSDSAFYFDGLNSRIEVPASHSLNGCKSFTVALWFKNDLLLSSNSLMFLMNRPLEPADFHTQCFTLEITLTNLRLLLANGHYTFKGVAGKNETVYEKNVWYHVAGVYDFDKKEARIYINGELANRDTVPITARFSSKSPYFFGIRYWQKQYVSPFKGAMDDIRLYNRALSDAEVKSLTRGFVFPKTQDAYEKTGHLAAGRYVVKSVDSAGALNPDWRVVEVSAEEPLWKKGWFIASCILATFLLTFCIAYFYNRNKQQEQLLEFEKIRTLERERFRIAREMHNDIGSGLSAINLLTEIALNKSKDPLLAAEIERIAAASRDVHSRIQDIIWAISLQNDTLASLLQYLRRFAADLLAPTGIASHFDAPDNIPAHIISGERRRAVFLAYKEALNNIVKHARATQVDIRCEVSGHFATIEIRDNGRGFDPSAAGDSGNGLINMKKRMEDADGQFRLESGAKGTIVVFRLPL